MKVRLNFSVSENALPALLIIRSFDGRLILYKRIYRRQNFLCFCTCRRNLIITVRPYNADYGEISKFIKLENYPCGYIRENFRFSADVPSARQIFYLSDENYGFPVEIAALFFNGVG